MKSIWPAVLVGVVIGFAIGVTYATPYGKRLFKAHCEKEFDKNFDMECISILDKRRDSAMFYKGMLTAYFEMQFYKP